MKKTSPKKFGAYILTGAFVVMSAFLAQSAYAALSCSATSDATTCTAGGGTVILKMSGSSNAHAANPISADYDPLVVCCSGVTGLSYSCSTGVTSTVLWLAGSGNAHAAQTQTNANYTSNACIGVGTGGTVSVGYTTGTDCVTAGYHTTVASMSSTTNAHVGTSTVYTNKVCASATSTPTGLNISGTLTSSLFDSAVTGGAGYNSIMWVGTIGTGKVKFQFATSDSNSGPWVYKGGTTCGTGDWFDAPTSGVPVELKGSACQTDWNNKRYYRYKVQLCSASDCTSNGSTSPVVSKIVVNWTP